MQQRAAAQERTRLRITESAAALHEEVGPARTSISAVAERAGVRRSTVYRHFPDEEALFAACSSHWMAAHPPPALEPWAAIAEPQARLAFALGALYRYYRETAGMLEQILRDEQLVPVISRFLGAYREYLVAATTILAAGHGARGRARRRVRAAIGHALALTTWRSLTGEQQLSDEEAAALMCELVAGAAHAAPARARRRAS
jgi:AcrR family transcriptional regulator